MATARAAIGSVIGTVAKTANLVTTTVDTIDQTMMTLNDKARNFRRHQRLTDAGREANFESNLEQTLAQEAAQLEYQTTQWAAQNPELKGIYDNQLTKIREAIAAAKAQL